MNRALWIKAWREVRVLLPAFLALMFGFHWMFAWITSQIDMQAALLMLKLVPEALRRLSPVPIEVLASYQGRMAFAYEHPVVEFGGVVWAIARGSDAVSGPLGRGTLEMTLAQPVRRIAVLGTNAVVTTVGLALISLACWLGTCVGIALIANLHDLSPIPFAWAAGNLFATMFFLAGFTTLLSSWDNARGRTIGLAVTFYVAALVCKVVGRSAPRNLHWMGNLSFLTCFEPQQFAVAGAERATLVWQYDGTLVGLGLLSYALATVIFCRRDLPAPL